MWRATKSHAVSHQAMLFQTTTGKAAAVCRVCAVTDWMMPGKCSNHENVSLTVSQHAVCLAASFKPSFVKSSIPAIGLKPAGHP
jgi:hypothetical protein